MLMPVQIEVGDTRQFTLVFSSVAGTTPTFNLHVGSTLAYSATGQSSGAGLYYAFFTAPNSPNLLVAWTWTASFTSGPVIERDLFQIIQTAGW